MKKHIILALMAIMTLPLMAQEGKCGDDVVYSFDGNTLKIQNVNKKGLPAAIENYDMSRNLAPWRKKTFSNRIKRVEIGVGITSIGSCAFANCGNLQEVLFQGTNLQEIGWGAFMNCTRLRMMSLPQQLQKIETIAFANCSALTTVKVPDHCRVGVQAFVSCTGIKSLEVAPTALLGHYAFASEVKVDDEVRHSLYAGEILRLPSYINKENAAEYGISPSVIKEGMQSLTVDYDYKTSSVDSIIPINTFSRSNTYALVIGNQNYRFVSDVPYAIHDARVFGEYCKKTLGIPSSNIHISEDATKQMILEEELADWLEKIPNREEKNLIVYYAGHGVPDVKDNYKAYLLPTDVRGTAPQRGISLDDFYKRLGDMAFNQTSVFLDACFSGVNRDSEGVTEGLRGVEVDAEEATLSEGSLVVFSAAQGNETAQGFPEEGHGLFTYYLLKAIGESYGDISFGDLSDRLTKQVSEKARDLKLRKNQTPAINTTEKVADSWRMFQF